MRRLLIVLCVCTLCANVFSACGRSKSKERPAPVVTAQAEMQDAPYVLNTVGTIKASVSVNIKSKYAAHIKKVHFVEGSLVKAGQLLFTIDPRINVFADQQAGATHQRDKVDFEQLERDRQRYKVLAEQDVISRESYEEKNTAALRARNAMRASGAGASLARQNLSYNTITSPIDGRIGAALIDEGTFVKDKDDILAVVNTTTPLEVSFALPERYLHEIRKHMALGPLTVQAAAPGMESHPEVGVLTFMDNQVESGTGTVRMKARFENPEGRLWPGQFVTVGLVLKTVKNAIIVPDRAVQNGPQGTYVFVVKDGKADMRPVTVGFRLYGALVLEQGLAAGETVVVEGHLRLVPGAKVEATPMQQAPAPGAPAAPPAEHQAAANATKPE
ncbi:MAG: efflux RND transporter periplasmic adaptor subunit [Humidesulfovibrio sp.]|uniref:efflux RND transporter periplasmic adaptor subunit n=1 Tax=Humidesulfovibrio sp. TaxID=2910988 RepID=UPI002733B16C|nr:efflux RND transporter periplasmic adaptor subunit [Humidesulfovibrio sp.]MDP2846770.1 efflux RND transporter periplasmic adaptor subunit [Humidesulfovibrio sp.]